MAEGDPMTLPHRRLFMHLVADAASTSLIPRVARTQTYRSRPITMVVPFAAGGSFDALARILAPRLSEVLGQQVIVENVSGAAGMTGASRVAKAAPDGHQI